MKKQIKDAVAEITRLAFEVTTSCKEVVMVDYAGHVQSLSVSIRVSEDDWVTRIYDRQVYVGGLNFNEDKSIRELDEIKFKLKGYLVENPFQEIWERFKPSIEESIVRYIHLGYDYSSESLFHDVMIDTDSYELSLQCVYESLKIAKSEGYAKLMKSELLDLIEWLDNNIHANYSEYQKEVI